MPVSPSTRDPFDDDFCKLQAEFCSLFANPTRTKIFRILQEGETSVSEIAERVKASIQSVSQHLRLMRDRGAVVTRKDGNQVYYRISNPKFLEATRLIREAMAEELQKRAGMVSGILSPPGAKPFDSPGAGQQPSRPSGLEPLPVNQQTPE